MVPFSRPWIDEAAVVEAVDNHARCVPQHHAALFDGDGATEERRIGDKFWTAEPLVGRLRPLIAGGGDRCVSHNGIDFMIFG